MDLSIVNEETNDVRVFMNSADGTCRIDDFSQPGNPVRRAPSPSEAENFGLGGRPDPCTPNIPGDSVSILLENADGTHASAQTIPTGNGSRGIAVLDLGGDGDLDIASIACYSSTPVFLHNRSEVFGDPTTFEDDLDDSMLILQNRDFTPPFIPGDLNHDGKVSDGNLGIPLGSRGGCPAPCPTDLNGDGLVGGTDLGLLLDNWG